MEGEQRLRPTVVSASLRVSRGPWSHEKTEGGRL